MLPFRNVGEDAEGEPSLLLAGEQLGVDAGADVVADDMRLFYFECFGDAFHDVCLLE
jgi:hypothetical protein